MPYFLQIVRKIVNLLRFLCIPPLFCYETWCCTVFLLSTLEDEETILVKFANLNKNMKSVDV